MYSLGIPETTTDVPARSRMLTQSTYDLRYEKNVSRAVLIDESLFPVRDAALLARRIDWWIAHQAECAEWGEIYWRLGLHSTHPEYLRVRRLGADAGAAKRS